MNKWKAKGVIIYFLKSVRVKLFYLHGWLLFNLSVAT